MKRQRLPRCSVALLIAALAAGACGTTAGTPDTAAEASAFASTRTGAGIAAAGGLVEAVTGPDPCLAADSGERVKIAYVGPELSDLPAIGLDSLVIEEPRRMIDAYVSEVNEHGGVRGRCVEVITRLWSLTDMEGSFAEICGQGNNLRNAIFAFDLRFDEASPSCAAEGARVPTIGLYASTDAGAYSRTGGRLFSSAAGPENLLINSVDVALRTGIVQPGTRIGLIHGPGHEHLAAEIAAKGLVVAGVASVPEEFGNLTLLDDEKRVRLLESSVSGGEAARAQAALDAMSAETVRVLASMEQFFTDAAREFQAAGTAAVFAAADWFVVRRMMRAADRVGFEPVWVLNDMQPATLTLTDAPVAQAERLMLISDNRAAGDTITDLDRGCVSLRNTAESTSPFQHRHHTDAWILLGSICDYLDVVFAAMTRSPGLTRWTFAAGLGATRYETAHGAIVEFGPNSPLGAGAFRVLRADPGCALDEWGCMRPATPWFLHTPQPSGTLQ